MAQGTDAVHGEAVLRVHHLQPGAGIGLAQFVDRLVRSHTQHDPRRIKPVNFSNRCAQGPVIHVGIPMQFRDAGSHRGRGLW